LPLAWQVAGTALVALVVALPLAGLAAAAAIASPAGMRRSLRHALVLVTAAVLAGTAAWQAEAGIPDESRLRDVVSRCFDNSPVAPPFTALMPIMPRATPQATDPAGATAYQITELRRNMRVSSTCNPEAPARRGRRPVFGSGRLSVRSRCGGRACCRRAESPARAG
jgi:hypothetical protein